jgi:hypothetical protein
MVNGYQHTITWHVDDVKSSHGDKKVNDNFLHWLKTMYASNGIGELNVTRGLRHHYLAMTLDYIVQGILKHGITTFVAKMVEDFPAKIPGVKKCPWNKNLFKDDESAKKLSKEKAETFHTFVMKGMFLCKQGRQDIQPGIDYSTRVHNPDKCDWRNLIKIIDFLKVTIDIIPCMTIDDKFYKMVF